jgi:Flp pilus assembly pilin Flp
MWRPGRWIAVTAGWWVRNVPRPAAVGSGQGIVEYGLMLSLMVVVAAVILVVFGGTLAEVLSAIGAAIDRPS